ncbi:MAG: hypothetical protein ACE1Z6_03850 [Candidatus Methylomirabilales bacterium]|nr:hypothetical protein [candidate division NC10 bacterium]
MRKEWIKGMAVLLFLTNAGVGPAAAAGIPTKVIVRAVSRDAKVIGTNVGGARITIRDTTTGMVLAEGVQKGGTGNTKLIMIKPRARGATVYNTPNAAGFLATVMLERPTVVEVTAEGPLGTPQSTQRVSKTLLLVPGQDVLGEGILLEIHGFTVALLAPTKNDRVSVGSGLEVRAKVTMT